MKKLFKVLGSLGSIALIAYGVTTVIKSNKDTEELCQKDEESIEFSEEAIKEADEILKKVNEDL